MVSWSEAILAVRTADCVFAILPVDGRPCMAAERIAQLDEGPGGLAALNDGGAGSSWQLADNGEVWIGCGLLSEAHTEWEDDDGSRVPAGFRHLRA